MFEFLSPWSMAAGGALISSPIIIHLINRMRFKRIRWAAMEFLLKSQKRNRRRLIIEQLILLLLRILLVLLIALIAARLIRFSAFAFGLLQPQDRHHVVVLDDTPSMGDHWKADGEDRNAFMEAKQMIVKDIARNAAQASKTQQLKLLTLSQPDRVLFDQRLNDDSIRELDATLAPLKPSYVHVELLKGVERAKAFFEETPEDERILYLVSDFRQIDWGGPGGQKLQEELKAMSENGVHVKLVDSAFPPRRASEKDPQFHENLAITRLEPKFRVVARNMPPTEFTVTVKNNGLTERQNVQVRVKLNGRDQAGSSVPIASIPPGGQVDATFPVYLDELGVNQISANLEPEETGLMVDDVRYAAVEVRERVPILLVDGDPTNSKLEGGDYFYMQILFGANGGVAPGYDVKLGTLADLERNDLDRYPTIYIVNVRDMNEKALKNLETYVKDGGSVAFFLGDQVNPDFYNKALYNGGSGLFPVPLAAVPSRELGEKEKLERMFTDLANNQVQMFVMNEQHPVFEGLLASLQNRQYREFFKLLTIDRHWPVPRGKWDPAPGQVEELLTLPNRNSTDDYKDAVQELLRRLPIDDEAFEKYRSRLLKYRDDIRLSLTSNDPLYKLADHLDRLLTDTGLAEDRENRPDLTDMWQLAKDSSDSKLSRLHGDLERMRDTVLYGDPLMVSGKFGKGRVIACMTTFGKKWNTWPVSSTFPIVMIDMQKYLTGVTGQSDQLVAEPLHIEVDASRYDVKMRRWFKPEENQAGGMQDMGEEQGTITQGRLHFDFEDANKPGVYVLDLYPKVEGAVESKAESRGFAFNIDARSEGDLQRIQQGLVKHGVPDAEFYGIGSKEFAELQARERDLSESEWPYVAFLIILLLEQALAVHLSYHLRGSEAAPPAAVLARSQAS